MAIRAILVAISTLVLVFYVLGITKHLTSSGKNTCEMTYMFEYPQYVHIELSDKLYEQYPRYGLYAYGEGIATVKLRAMDFSGIPVLFIPGNAGSYQQVRSLASISLRKSIKDRTPFHFDFFTVDLNEEYSALHGGILADQMNFVSHCIERILEIYSSKVHSVVIVAHSMGGIVAKGVILESRTHVDRVNTLFTLATPHQPILVTDSYIAEFYQQLENFEQKLNSSDIISVSIGSGPRDLIVNTHQTIDPTADLNVVTTAIPGVWKSTDHLCILWCKEFVQTIIRVLFDSVDSASHPPRITSDKEYRLAVLNYHLLHRSGRKKFSKYQIRTEFTDNGVWMEDLRRQHTWPPGDRGKSVQNKLVYRMIRLIGREDQATIIVTNLEHVPWLFACSASHVRGNSRICKWGWNLSNMSRIFPDDARREKKIVDLDLNDLKVRKLSHVVLKLPFAGNAKKPSVAIDIYSKSDRNIKLNNWYAPFNWIFTKLGTIRSKPGQLRYEINVGDGINTLQVYLKSIECNEADYNHQATIELLEPWNRGAAQFYFFSLKDSTPKTFTIQTRYSLNENTYGKNATPVLMFTLDPECAYQFEIWNGGFLEHWAFLARNRWQNLYGTFVALALLALAKQVDGEMGWLNSMHVTIITVTLCFGFGIGLEGLVSLALLYFFVGCIGCIVILHGWTITGIIQRGLTTTLRCPETWSTWIFGVSNQLPLLTATIILSIVPVTCGAVAMFLALAMKFLKLMNCYEDYLEKLFWSSLRDGFVYKLLRKKVENGESDIDANEPESNSDKNQIWYQLVSFIVYCLAAISAIPAILTWIKNYRYGMKLTTEDPYLTFCWMILACCESIGGKWIPANTPNHHSKEIATVVRLLGWAALIITGYGYPRQFQYKMPLLITTAAVLISLRSVIGFITS